MSKASRNTSKFMSDAKALYQKRLQAEAAEKAANTPIAVHRHSIDRSGAHIRPDYQEIYSAIFEDGRVKEIAEKEFASQKARLGKYYKSHLETGGGKHNFFGITPDEVFASIKREQKVEEARLNSLGGVFRLIFTNTDGESRTYYWRVLVNGAFSETTEEEYKKYWYRSSPLGGSKFHDERFHGPLDGGPETILREWIRFHSNLNSRADSRINSRDTFTIANCIH